MGQQTGRILWVHKSKEFGFIKPHDRLRALIPFSTISIDGHHCPEENHLVQFCIVEGATGEHADRVRIVGKIFSKGKAHMGADF